MSRKLIIAILLSNTLLLGCATQQGKDLSTSGIAYTDAVCKLIDVTTEVIIDFDSAGLRKIRSGTGLRERLTDRNEELIDIINELNRFRTQTKLLRTYFINLQALADSKVKENAGEAVKSASDSISKLNQTAGGENGKESLSQDQKKQIGALGGMVAGAIHAEIIRQALKRDAEVIGTYLALQENQLANITGILKDRFSATNDLFLEEEVIDPYVDTNSRLPANWDKKRKQWILNRFANQQLDTANEAAKQLRTVWENILKGKSDIDSLHILVSDINDFVATVKSLTAAMEPSK